MLVAFSNINAQNFRFKPLVGGTNTISKFTRLPKIDEHENILFSMLLAILFMMKPKPKSLR